MADNIDYSKIPESDCIINYIKERYSKGLYTLLLAIGLPGTGKSSACQRIGELTCEAIGRGQVLNRRDIVDSLEKFLERLINVKGPGEVIVIEEVSVLFPSRRAMSSENVTLARVLDTCRKKQVIILSNAPVLSTVDGHMRQMAHILIETQRINKKEEVCVYSAWKLQTNPRSGKTYTHRFHRNGFDVDRHYVRKPSDEVWKQYELDKEKFLSDLYKLEVFKAVKKKEDELKKLGIIKVSIDDALTKTEKRRWELRQQGYSNIEIAKMEGVKQPAVSEAIVKAENKLKSLAKSEKLAYNLTAGPSNTILGEI